LFEIRRELEFFFPDKDVEVACRQETKKKKQAKKNPHGKYTRFSSHSTLNRP